MLDLETQAACREVVIRFVRHLDGGEFDQVVALFAEDGVWHRQGKALHGASDIAAALQGRDPSLKTQHLIQNLVIEGAERDEVSAQYTTLVYAEMGGQAFHLHNLFLCEDRLTRTQDGWRISLRKAAPAFSPHP